MKKFLKKMCLLVMAIALTLCIFTACENEKNDNNDGGNDVTETPNDNQNPNDNQGSDGDKLPTSPENPNEPETPSNPSNPSDMEKPDVPEKPNVPVNPDNPIGGEVTDEIVKITATYNGSVDLGETLKKSAFSVNIVKQSGEKEPCENFTYGNLDSSTAGLKRVTVSYGDYECDVMIRVRKVNMNQKVYYSNSLNWGAVYAYCWNTSTGESNAQWPGIRCTDSVTNAYNETVFCYTVNKKFDRIIFNNGSGSQTLDLVVSECTSAYYGQNGVYTYGAESYGTINTVTLNDSNFPSGKKVHIYTPSGYDNSGKTEYGVLYMFDGQNIFVSNGSYVCSAGSSWAVDRAITSFMNNSNEGIIVVGIDNGNANRDSELTMSLDFGELTALGSPQYGSFSNGILDEMGDFITDTVMPYINDNYAVSSAREKTGIAGSSSGGLGAFYIGLRERELFGYVGAFSPATSLFYENAWQRFLSGLNLSEINQKMYIYCGKNADELENMLYSTTGTEATTDTLRKLLTEVGYNGNNIKEYYWDGANHNETYWRIAFMDFLSFALTE